MAHHLLSVRNKSHVRHVHALMSFWGFKSACAVMHKKNNSAPTPATWICFVSMQKEKNVSSRTCIRILPTTCVDLLNLKIGTFCRCIYVCVIYIYIYIYLYTGYIFTDRHYFHCRTPCTHMYSNSTFSQLYRDTVAPRRLTGTHSQTHTHTDTPIKTHMHTQRHAHSLTLTHTHKLPSFVI